MVEGLHQLFLLWFHELELEEGHERNGIAFLGILVVASASAHL